MVGIRRSSPILIVYHKPWFFAISNFRYFQRARKPSKKQNKIIYFNILHKKITGRIKKLKIVKNKCCKKPWIPRNPILYKRFNDLNGLSDGDFSSSQKSAPGGIFFSFLSSSGLTWVHPLIVIFGRLFLLSSSGLTRRSREKRSPYNSVGPGILDSRFRGNDNGW